MTVDQNNEDQPLSSEELLRRARGGLGESGATPPADFSIESYPPPAPPDYGDIAEPETNYETEMDTPTEDRMAERYDYPPPVPEPEPTPTIRDEGVGSWAPPPIDSADTPPWTPAPAPQPARGSRISIGSIIGVVVLLGAIGVFLINFFDSSKTVDEIAVGDCLDIPEEDEFSTIDPIDCTEPHDLEVYAILDMSTQSMDYSIVAPYPGDDAVYEAALGACLDPFESYVGTEYESSVLWVDAFTPTIEGWEELDDREVQCVLVQLNEDLTDIVKSDRSFRNSGL